MRLTGGEIVREYLIKEKVPYFVGIVGHGCLGLVDAFKGKEDKIKILQVRHEQSAAHLADGYYRATGKPLAVFTSIGPGATNTITGVATSYVDSTAMLVLTGNTHTYMRGTGTLQEIERQHDADSPQMFRSIVKRYWEISRVDQIAHIMQRAFNYMLTGRPGPVLIDLPMDVQSDSAEVEIPEPSEHSFRGRILGDTKEIEKAADLLFNAKRPVILAGGGVITSGASNELRELAEFIGAAVITTMMGKGAFPQDHSLDAWHAGSKGTTCGNKLASSSDVLLAVGCRFADETTCSYRKGAAFSIPPTKLIHIDLDPNEIGKNYPVEVGIIGDAKEVLGQILQILKENKKKKNYENTPYFKEIQKLKEEWLASSLKKFQNPDKVPMTMSCFLKELREFLNRDAFVVSSSGNAQAQILQEFPFYEPKTYITSGGFSTMGFSLPAALGVKLACPDRQVIAVVGDGDFLMTMQELATAVQYNMPVVVAVLDNIGWASIKDLQMGVFGNRPMATDFVKDNGDLYTPDFAAIAKGFGMYSERIEKSNEVKEALRRAFASGKPALIHVMVNREWPYGETAGWWDVPVPAYLSEQRAKYEREKAEERLI